MFYLHHPPRAIYPRNLRERLLRIRHHIFQYRPQVNEHSLHGFIIETTAAVERTQPQLSARSHENSELAEPFYGSEFTNLQARVLFTQGGIHGVVFEYDDALE